jgi:hypothetical protein
VGEQSRPVATQLADQRRTVGRHRRRRGDFSVAHRDRLGEDRVRAVGEPRRGPSSAAGQIDRRRPRGLNPEYGGSSRIRIVLVQPGRQRDPERPRDAQRRGAAHGQRPDRGDQLIHGGQPQDRQPARQRRLVDDLDGAVHPIDRAHPPTLAASTTGRRYPRARLGIDPGARQTDLPAQTAIARHP